MHVLPPEDGERICYHTTQTAYFHYTGEVQAVHQRGISLPGGEGEGHEDALDSRAWGGQTELHSPVIHQIELHISTTHALKI